MALACQLPNMGNGMWRGVGFSLTAAVIVSCAVAPAEDSAPAQHASIIDGDEHPGDPGVMYIVADNAFCTGALIAPRVLLTAKHCILDVDPGTIGIGMGPDAFTGVTYANVLEVRTTATHDLDGKDIAVLLLDGAGSASSYPWVLDNAPKRGDAITVVGYGQQQVGKSGSAPSGIKQSGTTTILRLYPKESLIDGPTTCFGDSGAPAFLDDGRIFGVVSRGTPNCKGTSLLTRTDHYTDLLAQAVIDTGGLAPDPYEPAPEPQEDAHAAPLSSSDADADVEAADGSARGQSSDGCAIAGHDSAKLPLWLLCAVGLLCLRAQVRRSLKQRYCARTRHWHHGARTTRDPRHHEC